MARSPWAEGWSKGAAEHPTGGGRLDPVARRCRADAVTPSGWSSPPPTGLEDGLALVRSCAEGRPADSITLSPAENVHPGAGGTVLGLLPQTAATP